ncbi:MAG: hypothetical protein AYP45_12865 [Candidatus Brocadia carolinensis]|uniref:DUF5618 domain-containing protein n=1 Tax=Candidatus Brocadia carolinensis TaxID=1004156 RepID=A0A1V4ARN0_9BACT|nr:MAG: hypothetical protein AYP45_12865 [Candidatus Brocadia caroliniensis]
MENERGILAKASIEGKFYTIKPVREAFGTAYLAVLEAINENLIKKGILEKELPKSVDEYRKILRKYLAVHNSKLLKEFEILYDSLHIYGYYQGGIYNVHAVKDYLAAARDFVNKLSVVL